MKRKLLILLMTLALAASCLTGCGDSAQSSSEGGSQGEESTQSQSQPQPQPSPQPEDKLIATLIADTSTQFYYEELIREYEWGYEGELTPEMLAEGLSELTGLDFFLTATVEGSVAKVDWALNSTLVGGLDDREQKEDFFFFESDSLSWFMMNSMMRTLEANLGITEVYYSMDGGKDLELPNLYHMQRFEADSPYMGSLFYFAHMDTVGENAYTDVEDNVTLTYPGSFDAVSMVGDVATFPHAEDGVTLSYWSIPNTYGDTPQSYMEDRGFLPPDGESEWLDGDEAAGVIVSWHTMEGEGGAVGEALLWVVQPERILVVCLECPADSVMEWFEVMKKDIKLQYEPVALG